VCILSKAAREKLAFKSNRQLNRPVAAIAALLFVAHRFAAQRAKRLVARLSYILVRFEIRQLRIDLHTYFSICSFCKMHATIDQSVFYSFNGTTLPMWEILGMFDSLDRRRPHLRALGKLIRRPPKQPARTSNQRPVDHPRFLPGTSD
jgi:hypothetical protein